MIKSKGLVKMTRIHMTVFAALCCLLTVSTALATDKVYTLEDAYAGALGTSEFMKIAEEGVIQSDDRIDQAWSTLYPHLNLSSSFIRYNDTLPRNSTTNLFQPLEQVQTALVLTQTLYTGGRTLAALRTANKMREASRSDLSVAKQDIFIRVSEAYYGVLKAQKSVEISKRSLERMEHHKQVTEREASTRKTKANASALLRANTLVSQARISMIRAQDGIKVAREKLNLLTKLPVDAQIAEPHLLDQPTDKLDDLKALALKNRDDYAGSKLNSNIAEENVTIVRGSHYPQIYAEAGFTYLDSYPMTLMDATTYYGGLKLSMPLFEGGLMKAEVSEAKSKQRQAELATELLRRSIESDVHEAYINLQTVASVLETAKLQMEYAKTNFDAVEGMFGEGLVPSLSLIDAEQALNMAERELVNATYDQQVLILRLRKSIGKLGKEA